MAGFIYNSIGIIGVILILIAYVMLQSGSLQSNRPAYPLLNFFGALGIMVSLIHAWNLASFIIEVCWMCISIFGLWRIYRTRHSEANNGAKESCDREKSS